MTVLSPRSISTLGIGYGAQQTAYLGLWPYGETPEEPEAVVGSGTAGRAARRRNRIIPLRHDAVQYPKERDQAIAAIAERRAQEFVGQKSQEEVRHAELHPQVHAAIEAGLSIPPQPVVVSRAAVEARLPGGVRKWQHRGKLELRTARASFNERERAQKALIAYEKELREQLQRAQQIEELDLVFVSAMMALSAIDD